jgi:hypothetical protein
MTVLRTDARRQLILGHISGSRIFRAWRGGEESERLHDHDPTQLRATLTEEGVELELDANNDVVEIHYREPNSELGEQVVPALVFDQDLGHIVHVWSQNDIEAAVPTWDGKSNVDLEGRILLKRSGTTVVLPSDGSYLRWQTFAGSQGGTVGSIVVFNVRDYGAVGDGVHDDTNAIRAAVTACQLAGGGIVYFPNGTYLISEHGTSLRCIEIFARVSIVGQSHAAIVKAAGGLRSSCRMFYVTNGSTDLTIANIKLDGNRANQTDQTGLLHNDAIFLDNTSRVRILDVDCGFAAASPLIIWQNSVDTLVQHCYFHDSGWLGVALGDAFGQKNILVTHCRLQGNAGGFHMEVSGNCDNVRVEHSYMDGTPGNAALEFTGGGSGSDPTLWATNLVARDCQVKGYVFISQAGSVLLQGVNVNNADVALNEHAAVRIIGTGSDVVLDDCFITQSAAGSATEAVIIAGNTINGLTGVRIFNTTINVQSTACDGLRIQQCKSFRADNLRIVGNPNMQSGQYGVNINAKALPSNGNVALHGVHVIDFPIGVVAQSVTSSVYTANFIATDCIFESVTPGLMTAAFSLDLDGHHTIQNAASYGHELIGVSTLYATYPNVPMLIGGSRGGVGIYSTATAPAFAASQGSEAIARDTGEHYLNMTGASNGWKLVTHAA